VTTTLRVKNWGSLYESHRSREIKKLSQVLVPNGHDSDGYTTLVDHPNGAAHLGAWLAILQIASRCKERGVLANSDGKPLDPINLARMSRLPAAIFEEVIPRLTGEVRWLEEVEEIPRRDAGISRDGAGIRRESATPIVDLEVEVSVVGRGGVEEKPASPHELAATVAEETAGPLSVLKELSGIYQAGGLPIADKHQQLILQHLIGMSPAKLERLANYVKWAFATGRWPSPAKTKALLQLIRDGDWDVDFTARTLPAALQSRPPSKAQEAQDIAAARVREKYGAAV